MDFGLARPHNCITQCLEINLLCCSVAKLCLTLCNPMDCSMPRLPVLHYLRVCSNSCPLSQLLSNHFILCHPLLLPSIFPSITIFSTESALCIRWPKYCSCGFSISPSNEYSRLISFWIDWFDVLAVQETLKTLLHNSRASTTPRSAFFVVQLSHLFMTTGKTTAVSIWTFVGKVLSLLMHCLGLSLLSSQGASAFEFHGGSHHLQ